VGYVFGPTCRSSGLLAGRWGPMGTHVSQALDRRVGEEAEAKLRRSGEKT
jgi:hypothetical protein